MTELQIAFFLTLFGISTLCYSGAILFLFRGLISNKKLTQPNNLKFSVIIAARNEESEIGDCLDSVINQSIDSSRYEVIVVNDRSTDATEEILNKYKLHCGKLSVLSIHETPFGISPKKYAVQKGVEFAKNEIVVFTDADCRVNETWLDTIDKYFCNETGLVQGITMYYPVKTMNKHFYSLQAIDFLSHGVVAASAIGANFPINSNANNMAFRRSIFTSLNGYGNKQSIVSGDDDLLLQRVWNEGSWKIRFMVDEQGAVRTKPTESFRQLLEQRKRWGSKTVHYSGGQVVLLTAIFLFYLAIFSSFFLALFNRLFLLSGATLLIFKITGEYLLLYPGTALFKAKNLRKYVLFASILQLPLVVYSVISGVFGKFTWKEQRFTRTIKN